MEFGQPEKPRPPRLAPDREPFPTDDKGATDTLALAAILSTAVPKTGLAMRARLLRRLLMPIGPLALTVLGGGAFAKYAGYARWSRLTVSLEDAARLTSNQIVELVNYIEQSDPTVLEQVMVILSRDATTLAALGASVAAIGMQLAARRKPTRTPTGK
jgi:hypothetical protein